MRVAFDKKSFDFTIVYMMDEQKNATNSFNHFVKQHTSHVWNHYIYSEILLHKYKHVIEIHKVNYKGKYVIDSVHNNKTPKQKIIILLDKIFGFMQHNYRVIFVSSSFRLDCFIKLCFRLKQFPRTHNYFFKKISFNNKFKNRGSIQLRFNAENDFEFFLKKYICSNIPISYVEGYNELKMEATRIKCEAPVIFTSFAHLENDLFNHWCANKVEGGVKLIVSQHGGSLKSEMSVFLHQEKISEKMVVWHKTTEKNHIRLSPAKMIGFRVSLLNNSEIIIIAFESSLYPYRAQSGPKAGSLLDDFKQKIDFIRMLSPYIYQSLMVKAFDRGEGFFNSRTRYSNELGSEKISPYLSLRDAISNARIIVCTYPQTTFMEAMASGVPTILIYPEQLWEFLPVFDDLITTLKHNNIIFTSSKEAAQHVNTIWDDPLKWWESPSVIKARQSFFETCGQVKGDWLNEWSMFFLKLKK